MHVHEGYQVGNFIPPKVGNFIPPLTPGLKGVVVAEGETYEEALAEVKSAIQFHIETFGNDAFENDDIMETFVAEVAV